MFNTSSKVCREISMLLSEHGVKYVICSPGTRNAPLLMAFNRNKRLCCLTVIDERSAGFVALGLAQAKNTPVALCCTSGTALLNYAPAVAEAYYKGLPLIVISADRPAEWIDQADSQTIRQPQALAGIVSASYSVSDSQEEDKTGGWFANRVINEAILKAAFPGKFRPVHINVHLGEPLDTQTEDDCHPVRVIKNMMPVPSVPTTVARKFARERLAGKKIMIVLGGMCPDNQLSKAIARLSGNGNVVIMAEETANLNGVANRMKCIDPLFAYIGNDRRRYYPDVVIYAGGSIVSRSLKEFLREAGSECFRVGMDDNLTDTFMNLSGVFTLRPADFFRTLASAIVPYISEDNGFCSRWNRASEAAVRYAESEISKMEWCDFSAVSRILSAAPESFNLQVSNGMALRYAMNLPLRKFHRFDANRGVSGIDGCSSTALGATIASGRTTLFLSGDMCAQYDAAAFSSGLLSPRFKMVVTGNGNGGIFHIIRATRNLPEVNTLISPAVTFPAKKLAEAYGLKYFEASSFEELDSVLYGFIRCDDAPALLYIDTSEADSAAIYLNFIRKIKNKKNEKRVENN